MTDQKTPEVPTRPRSFPIFRQLDAMDCGPTCLRMIAQYYGRSFTASFLREKACIDRQGVSMLGIAYAAEAIGLRTLAARVPLDALLEQAPLPCVLHWDQKHFVVLYRHKKGRISIADPARGGVTLTVDDLRRHWVSVEVDGKQAGVVLLLEPTAAFFAARDGIEPESGGFGRLWGYVRRYQSVLGQVWLGLVLASLLQLVFPFLTQAIVDHGITNQNLSFVNLVLIAQLVLAFSRTGIEFIRNRVLFHVGSRVYLSLLSDFLLKMMRLPLTFFDTRMAGDIMQRVQDHQRVQYFISSPLINTLYAMVSLFVFTGVLAYYSWSIVLVFIIGTALYVAYVLAFSRARAAVDYRKFADSAASQNELMEIVHGMPEIKLANAEQQRRWRWEAVQARLFHLNLRSLGIEQFQQGGSILVNELKNITVTFLAAKLVIDGELTLGMLLAVQFIVGQLNVPVSQLIGFIQSTQDAKISLERMGEIHSREDEEQIDEKVPTLPADRTIRLEKVSYSYTGPLGTKVLDQLDLVIPEGKVTAIVGPSGSGKTTLLKLLLKFDEPQGGRITVGSVGLSAISGHVWRSQCGVVLQDGHVFSDTIAGNVAVGFETVDPMRLLEVAQISRIDEFVDNLPLGYYTKIGRDGIGLSAGQKQRILIARALYKKPAYLFFDEATSALDATNERAIMDRLESVFKGHTVVVIAHRLSTVKAADQIIVLDGGRIVEQGTHEELTRRRGRYLELVRNQLELGA
jgi:ATP-binding cassette, subfamily B, bacterial